MSILYQSNRLFHFMMAAAYRDHRFERFDAVARWIPHAADVLDVCCGDGTLAAYLSGSRYRGLDQSPAFVKAARKKGLDVDLFDLRRDSLTPSQIVVCQISLYQFHPEEELILARLFEAARDKLIVSESVRSLAQSRFPLTRWVGAWGMRTRGMTHIDFRFTPERLHRLFEPYRRFLEFAGPICAGRDWVYVLDKNRPNDYQKINSPLAA
jgi:SAM-dependent methyltransferase